MADGNVVTTNGRVRVTLKYGGYRGSVFARVFPNMSKKMILGIPWLSKGNPHIDWNQVAVVVKQDQNWIALPLAIPNSNKTQPILPTNSVPHRSVRCSQEESSRRNFSRDNPIGQRKIAKP